MLGTLAPRDHEKSAEGDDSKTAVGRWHAHSTAHRMVSRQEAGNRFEGKGLVRAGPQAQRTTVAPPSLAPRIGSLALRKG